MRDLLRDSRYIGSIRRRVVNINGSAYSPSSVPMLLEQTLHLIVDKARHIRNSVEDALLNVTVEAADLTALAPSPTPN
ncbi:MAG: hypothetical protein NWS01_00510 [Burkholderiales bacterium]|nr:hypothetical protein [Burkholderiales bacterium]